MDKVDIYTDGACSGNPGPGGWAFIIKYRNGKTKEFSGSEKYTTNNKMELTAAIKAIKYFKEKIIINKLLPCLLFVNTYSCYEIIVIN